MKFFTKTDSCGEPDKKSRYYEFLKIYFYGSRAQFFAPLATPTLAKFFLFLSFFFDELLCSDLPYNIITVGVASRMKSECKHPPHLRRV